MYTLDHIPLEHRLRASKEVKHNYETCINSRYWKNLCEFKEKDSFEQASYSSYSKTAYDSELRKLEKFKEILDAYILEHPEFVI